MMIKPILTLLFLSFTLMSFAQVSAYSDADKETFVKIHFELKDHKTNPEDLLAEVLSMHDINREDYLSLMQSDEPKDQNRLQAIKQEANNIQHQHNTLMVEQLCDTHSISTSLYLEMQASYEQEITFHQELRPYFTAYIKNKSK